MLGSGARIKQRLLISGLVAILGAALRIVARLIAKSSPSLLMQASSFPCVSFEIVMRSLSFEKYFLYAGGLYGVPKTSYNDKV